MKVSIGMNIQYGPYGGGNQFVQALRNFLASQGDEVVFDLKSEDIDVILLTDPRVEIRSCAYSYREIERYIKRINPNAIVVQRVNECDERKGTADLNQKLRRANKCADHTVFVSEWLRQLHISQGFVDQDTTVILNGSDLNIFNPNGYTKWDTNGPLKLVTHHWSGNWNKGFDIYDKLDKLLNKEIWNKRFTFTYIGNLPDEYAFTNSNHIAPLSGEKLACTIKSNHVYLTASLNEPGSNHQIEGANCGLPLLYMESGGLPETCNGYGIGFNKENFVEKLSQIFDSYLELSNVMPNYQYNADRTCSEYRTLFETMVLNREKIISRRQKENFFSKAFSKFF